MSVEDFPSRPDSSASEREITPREFGQAVVEGVLCPLVAILDGYTVYGGGAIEPPALFFEWLRDYRAQQHEQVPPSSASDRKETIWSGDNYGFLVDLHDSARLLRETLADLDGIIERAARAPTGETVEALVSALEDVGLFLRNAYRALGMELIQEPPETLQ